MDSILVLILPQIVDLHLSFDHIKGETGEPHESSWKRAKRHDEPEGRFLSGSIRSNWILLSLHILIESKIESISPGISNHGRGDTSEKTSKTILTVDFLSCVHARFVDHILSCLNLHSNSDMFNRASDDCRDSSSNSSRYQKLRNRQLVNVLLFSSGVDIHHKSLHHLISSKLDTYNCWYSSQWTHGSFVKSSRTFIVPNPPGQIDWRNWVTLRLHSDFYNIKWLTHKHL